MNIQTPLSLAFQDVDRNEGQYKFNIATDNSNSPVQVYVNFDPDHKDGIYHVSVGGYQGEDDQGSGFSDGKVSEDKDHFLRALSAAKNFAGGYGKIQSIQYRPDEGDAIDIPLEARAEDFKVTFPA
jgi:hypothetical protein